MRGIFVSPWIESPCAAWAGTVTLRPGCRGLLQALRLAVVFTAARSRELTETLARQVTERRWGAGLQDGVHVPQVGETIYKGAGGCIRTSVGIYFLAFFLNS